MARTGPRHSRSLVWLVTLPVEELRYGNPTTTEEASGQPAVTLLRANLFGLFVAVLAGIVRYMALATGQTVDATTTRLVAYGIEALGEAVVTSVNLLGLCHSRSRPQSGWRPHMPDTRWMVRTSLFELQNAPSDRPV
ncbi:MAG: hypothetical protein MUC44_00300 [Beijerinckiaceae bacterium]|nr:hypothetical protein [Beijerinckiaceae bacterium]